MKTLADFELRTQPGIWQRCTQGDSRRLHFHATTADDTRAWQTDLRTAVHHLLGGDGVLCDLDVQIIDSVQDDSGRFRRELLVIQTQPGEYMPCYVLTPLAPPPYKPAIALHGHGSYGARTIIGMMTTPDEVEHLRLYGGPYARQLVEAGCLVFAPVLRGFAERMETRELERLQHGGPVDHWLSSCHTLSINAMLCGKTLMGLRVWDVRRLIDYIQTRDDVQTTGLACVGLSGGGTLTLYTAGLDTRISCAYLSGCLNTFRESIMAIDHCLCNVIPGVLQYAEMGELAGLIAPRPLLVENGRDDPIYLLAGMQTALKTLRPIYRTVDAESRLEAHIFNAGHQWDGTPLTRWLKRWLV